MKRTTVATMIPVLLLLAGFTVAGAGPVTETWTPVAMFEWAWSTVLDNFLDPALGDRLLTPARHDSLLLEVSGARDVRGVKQILHPFLTSLGVSHMGFFTADDLEYHLFHSIRSSSIESHPVHHAGVQGVETDEGFRVLAAWDGLPTAIAGLRRGDLITAGDGRPFGPITSFAEGRTATLAVQRGKERLAVEVTPGCESINASLVEAMKRSVRRIERDGRFIGYVHVWSCTPPGGGNVLAAIVRDSLAGVDGILLDVRDGFGGYWYDYLEPFYESDRDVIPGFGRGRGGDWRRWTVPEFARPWRFSGPMVVLINEGTRSGKELLALQFRTTGRALLVGTNTKGYVTSGGIFFSPEGGTAAVYVAASAVKLGDTLIEGIGVAPDRVVEFPADGTVDGDPQIEAGIAALLARIAAESPGR